MIDWLIDLISNIFDGAEGVVDEIVDGVSSIDIADVVSTGLLVAGVITVASLTEDAIRSELSRRQELKNKGVTSAIVTDFISKNGYTEISLAALNNKNQQVGTVKMRAQSSSGIKKGSRIAL